jgi:hypothetical protein
MLKFIFWTLLLANGGLFAYQQGYLDSLIPSGREPARLAQQLNADKVRLLPGEAKAADQPAPAKPADKPASGQASDNATNADAANPAAAREAVLPADAGKLMTDAAIKPESGKKPEPDKKPEAEKTPEADKKAEADKTANAEKKAALLACTEIGNFSEADAGRFEARLASLTPGTRLSRRMIREAGSHMVFIPPQGSKESADHKVEQLRGLGVTDFYVIQDQSEMRWGISLGVFSSEESAKKRLEQLKQQGVRTARIGARNTINKVAIQLRALDAAGREKLEKVKSDFPQQQQRNCV